MVAKPLKRLACGFSGCNVRAGAGCGGTAAVVCRRRPSNVAGERGDHAMNRSSIPGGLTMAAVALVLVWAPAWQAASADFNFSRYVPTDLDELLAQPRPTDGIDLNDSRPLKLDVTLADQGEECSSEQLKLAMRMQGYTQEQTDATQASHCITVRSAKGKQLKVFIQDVVYAYLPHEVPLGGKLTLYAIHIFTDPSGPKLLVNEFLTAHSYDSSGPKQADEKTSCGCWAQTDHPGVDFTVDQEGAPVRAIDGGVVIKVELNDQAFADLPGIGGCGRYLVLRHDYPNGRILYTRYVKLGRIVGPKGEPLAVGMRVAK